jgi:hypothetical protein
MILAIKLRKSLYDSIKVINRQFIKESGWPCRQPSSNGSNLYEALAIMMTGVSIAERLIASIRIKSLNWNGCSKGSAREKEKSLGGYQCTLKKYRCSGFDARYVEAELGHEPAMATKPGRLFPEKHNFYRF